MRPAAARGLAAVLSTLALVVSAGWTIAVRRGAPGPPPEDDRSIEAEAREPIEREPPDDDYFYRQRVSRHGRLNLHARRDALRHARRLEERASFTTLAAGEWELRGPLNVGGRVADVVGDPTSPSKFYVGAASGGVWKTTDGGATFAPIFDGVGALSIGALALDPRNSDVLYVGTGEASPGGGSVTYPGDGVWKTTNGGATWQHVGLDLTVAIGRIVVDPRNPNNVFVAAPGHLFSRNI